MEVLGMGYELWLLGPVEHTELYARLYELERKRRLRLPAQFQSAPHEADVAYDVVQFTFDEVLNAAEGVERSYLAVQRGVSVAQAGAAEYFTSNPDSLDNLDKTRFTWSDLEAVAGVWYDLTNMFIWARTLQDRVKREGIKRADGTKEPDVGLLPSLAHEFGHRTAIAHAFGRLKSGHLKEVRLLTNYNLHGGNFKSPGTQNADVTAGGVLAYYMPDKVTARVEHWHELSFKTKRDALLFADELFQQIVTFMDIMIDAFAKVVPQQFRSP